MLASDQSLVSLGAPRLSIVVPSHDTRALTLRCLRSLRAAAPDDTEVILVDDASQDGTSVVVAREFPEIAVLRNVHRSGFTRTVNRGLEASRGSLILLLNSDTEVHGDSLGKLLQSFDAEPQLGIAGARLLFPDGRRQWSGGKAPDLPWLFALASGLPVLLKRFRSPRRASLSGGRVDWVSGAALTLRREVWTQIGPLDEGYRFYGQDVDYCTRARTHGWKVRILSDFVVVHHHGATISQQPDADPTRHQHPRWLWNDLLRWVRIHRGVHRARLAAAVLRWGGRCQLAALHIRRIFTRRTTNKEALCAQKRALLQALASLPRRRFTV